MDAFISFASESEWEKKVRSVVDVYYTHWLATLKRLASERRASRAPSLRVSDYIGESDGFDHLPENVTQPYFRPP